MGSGSRSISQETEEPVQQPLLMRQSAVSGSNTTLSSEYNSMSTNNDQHTLLPNTFEEESGTPIIFPSPFFRILFFSFESMMFRITFCLLIETRTQWWWLIYYTCSKFRLWKSNHHEKHNRGALLSEYANISIEFDYIPKCKSITKCFYHFNSIHFDGLIRLNLIASRINFWTIVKGMIHRILAARNHPHMMNKSALLVNSFSYQIHHVPMRI